MTIRDLENDPRVSLANERTLLAWVRTALGLVAGGLAATELLPDFDIPGGRKLIGLTLVGLGAVITVFSHRVWVRRERAIQSDQPLPPSRLPLLLTAGVAAAAAAAVIIVASGTST